MELGSSSRSELQEEGVCVLSGVFLVVVGVFDSYLMMMMVVTECCVCQTMVVCRRWLFLFFTPPQRQQQHGGRCAPG